MDLKTVKRIFVKYVYADHNQSKNVQSTLNQIFSQIDKNNLKVVNIGAGNTRIHPKIVNVDIFAGDNIDYVCSAELLPFENNTYDAVISQEVLEHIENPIKALKEINRILKVNGLFYCQVPFIIGYHPGPTDFLRFTKEGLVNIIEKNGFKIEKIEISVGGASGYYRISVEFWAIFFSLPIPFFYKFFKGLFAFILYPIKFLDFLFNMSNQKDRIPGGYFVLARKFNE